MYQYHSTLTMYYIRLFFMILSRFLYDSEYVSLFSVLVTVRTVPGAVTESNQMGTNTARTVTNTLHKVTLTNS